MNDNLKILVVDDEEAIRNIFKEYLELKRQYTVLTAADGIEALDIIQREEINCCFTDLYMPRLDGIELVKRIHLYDNTIPVVVMTGYPSMDIAVDTLRNGVVDFLIKPVRMDQVPLIIDRVMRESALFVDNILLKKEMEKARRLVEINEELQERIRDLETVNKILQGLNHASSSKDLFDMLVALSGKVTSCDEAHFCLLGHEIGEPAIITSFFRKRDKASAAIGPRETEIIEKVKKDGVPLIVKENNGRPSIIAVPLKIRDNTFGILLNLIRGHDQRFYEKDLYLLNFLAEKSSSLVENLALYENLHENLFSTLYAFVETIEARDPYTKQHSARVTDYAVKIAEIAGCAQEEIETLNISGNLHDIGKIGIPDNILLKPGRLTDHEFEIIKRHPSIGGNILGHFEMWSREQEVVKYHHERWDGKGYPDGLKGEEIPFLSRIISVADVYDALTSDRSYRKKLPEQTAAGMIRENSGLQFDPKIVEAFLEIYEQGIFKTDRPCS